MFTIHVEPHEIHKAIDAYKDWLSPEQIKMIKKRNSKFMIIRQAPLSTLVIWEGADAKSAVND